MKVLIIAILLFNSNVLMCPKVENLKVFENKHKIKNVDFELVFQLIKNSEGLRLRPYKDGTRTAIGYGTKAGFRKSITEKEAQCEMEEAYFKKLYWVNKKYPKLDYWSALVIAAFKYNVSNIGDQLNKAILSGDKRNIASKLLLYVKDTSGKKLAGLKKRRLLEAEILLSEPLERFSILQDLKN